MRHLPLELISTLWCASRIHLTSGFIAVDPAKKRDDCSTLLLGPPSPQSPYPVMRRVGSVVSAKKAAAADSMADCDERGDAADANVDAKSAGKRKRRKASTKPKKSTDPIYWHDEDDPFVLVANGEIYATGRCDVDDDDGDAREQLSFSNVRLERKSIGFTIRGNPRVLVRHRTARGFVYNPSRPAQDLFRDCLLELLPREHHPTIIDDEDLDDECDGKGTPSTPVVLFSQHEFLKMKVVFRMKRPKIHFVGSRPGPGRLKPSAPGKLHSIRSDVDNLAKFVMDALNGLVYVDDRQVVNLNVIKVLDSEGLCRGATDVEISVVKEEDW